MEKNKWVLSNYKLPLSYWYSNAMIALDSKLYLTGGQAYGTIYANLHYAYDTKTNTWEVKAPMPNDGKMFVSCVSCSGKLYVCGGIRPGTLLTTDLLAYDPETDTWEKKLDIPSRLNAAMCAVGEKIYICGGTDKLDKWTTVSIAKTLHVYDTESNSLEEKSSMPMGTTGFLFHHQNNLFCFGHTIDTTFCVQKYDIKKDRWELLHANSDMISGTIYSMAECDNTVYLLTSEKTYNYSFGSGTWNEVCVNNYKSGFAPVSCTTMGNKMIAGSGYANSTCNDFYELIPETSTKLHILLEEAEKINLTATLVAQDVMPDDLEWSSGSAEIATVDQNGVVTAVAPGSTKMTVRSPSSGFEACAMVLVIAKGESGLRLSILMKAGEKCRLVTVFNGEIGNAAWKSSDKEKVLVDNVGKVTAVAPGLAVVTATSDGSENTEQIYVTVTA